MKFKLTPPKNENQLLFSNHDLVKLMIPLIAEQFLMIFVGLVDTAMVSRLSEAAVSGVSLVDMINQLIIQILAALGTGGAVISSQYIGHREPHKACEAANQLIILVILIGLGIMAFFLSLRQPILRLFFGSIDDDVMREALTYMTISAISYPFIALYASSTAIFRSMKKTHIALIMSALMNVINVICNLIFIFGLDMGVAGAALGSLIGRGTAGTAACLMLLSHKHPVHLVKPEGKILEGAMVKRILYIGIPNGLENGMFQLGKILVASIISLFGTVQIAANAVAGNVAGLGIIPGFAIGLALVTVIGQCVGAGDYEQAEYYTKKMMRIAMIIMFLYNGAILLLRPVIISAYVLSEETAALANTLMTLHAACAMFLWVPAFTLPNALRASNDVKFTMTTSIVSMWVFRVGFSLILGKYLGWGAVGVWISMILDWIFRLSLFIWRFKSKKWQRVKLI